MNTRPRAPQGRDTRTTTTQNEKKEAEKNVAERGVPQDKCRELVLEFKLFGHELRLSGYAGDRHKSYYDRVQLKNEETTQR